jgi:hypothetical protein
LERPIRHLRHGLQCAGRLRFEWRAHGASVRQVRNQKVAKCHLYFNGLAPGAKVACQIGRIEALEECSLPLVSPTLETGSQKLAFPVSLKPDEYLEADWSGTVRHFDPNGTLLGNVTPHGSLRIATGDNRVKFSCTQSSESSPRAEVTISLRGQPLANARN